MAHEKLQLLYIASNGRSGSTLLEMLLGAHDHLWTTGELYVLPYEVRSPTKPCGCGAFVTSCPFWRPIVDDLRPVLLRRNVSRFRDWCEGGPLFRPRQPDRPWARAG